MDRRYGVQEVGGGVLLLECIYEFLKKSGGKQGEIRDSESRIWMTQREKLSKFFTLCHPYPWFPPDFFLEFVNKRVQ